MHPDAIENMKRYKIISRSDSMKPVFEKIDKVADSDATVLISGETGTGKELISSAIHDLSPRKEKRYSAINCSALPADLIESELFGHTRGAFTGAVKDKDGMLDISKGGTVFLDEIGHMDIHLQPKLLRAIEERRVRPVGSEQEKDINVRFIAATSVSRDNLTDESKFLSALYHRLNVLPIDIPPLRERDGDILELANYFIELYNDKYNKTITMHPDAISFLESHDWPGSVRELMTLMERLVVYNDDEEIGKETLKELKEYSMEGSFRVKTPTEGIIYEDVCRRLSALERKFEGIKSMCHDLMDHQTAGRLYWIDEMVEMSGVSMRYIYSAIENKSLQCYDRFGRKAVKANDVYELIKSSKKSETRSRAKTLKKYL